MKKPTASFSICLEYASRSFHAKFFVALIALRSAVSALTLVCSLTASARTARAPGTAPMAMLVGYRRHCEAFSRQPVSFLSFRTSSHTMLVDVLSVKMLLRIACLLSSSGAIAIRKSQENRAQQENGHDNFQQKDRRYQLEATQLAITPRAEKYIVTSSLHANLSDTGRPRAQRPRAKNVLTTGASVGNAAASTACAGIHDCASEWATQGNQKLFLQARVS